MALRKEATWFPPVIFLAVRPRPRRTAEDAAPADRDVVAACEDAAFDPCAPGEVERFAVFELDPFRMVPPGAEEDNAWGVRLRRVRFGEIRSEDQRVMAATWLDRERKRRRGAKHNGMAAYFQRLDALRFRQDGDIVHCEPARRHLDGDFAVRVEKRE